MPGHVGLDSSTSNSVNLLFDIVAVPDDNVLGKLDVTSDCDCVCWHAFLFIVIAITQITAGGDGGGVDRVWANISEWTRFHSFQCRYLTTLSV